MTHDERARALWNELDQLRRQRNWESTGIHAITKALSDARRAALIWTSEKPTRPGWYWYTLGPVVEVVRVYEYSSVRHPIRVAFTSGETHSIANCHGEWAGPIEPPIQRASEG